MLQRDPLRTRKGMVRLLLTPEDAADLLSIGRSKLYELIGDGHLASVRIGASRRVPMSALVEFVQSLQETWNQLPDGGPVHRRKD
ncbi:MAG TPA: helix-turn-helix domain-containing protein [Acidimicrobiia bacterium]|nr:helix-turn-helix domain-containing protein [Acidimicrobiia bacterium]